MMARRTICISTLLLLLTAFASTNAYADKYDFDLARLWEKDGSDWKLRGEGHFKGLMGDLGAALAPRFLGPAATLGALGFQIAVDYTLTNIPQDSDRWRTVMTDHTKGAGDQEGADSFLQTVALHVRKGLPFSAEVGGIFTKLLQSKMWGVGLELKYAALEGFAFLPELAFRGTVSTFLGSEDYAMLTTGGDVILSKKIGIAGLFKLAPFVGYNFLYVHGSSNVIPVGVDSGGNIEQQVFSPVNVFKHFAVFGFQTVATVVNFGFEAGLTKDLQIYSFRMGLEF